MENKEELVRKINTIVAYMESIDESRAAVNELIKEIKADFGIASSDIRAAATAIKKQNADELKEKSERISELIELCTS